MKFLIVVDMQNDFIDGALGTKEAVAILPAVKEKIKNFSGRVIFTRDTHDADYLSTQEGTNLPVEHCIKGTDGWQIHPELDSLRTEEPVDKPTFGSTSLSDYLRENHCRFMKDVEIEIVGVCTDICVIANAMLIKAVLPDSKICVNSALCAGVTPQSHQTALDAMKACHIEII